MGQTPNLGTIRRVAERIKPYIHQTPVFTCAALDQMVGARLLFKCENLQRAGAFKARGAANAVFSLSEQEAQNGVVTHSSGNFAAALAMAARQRGIPAYVVMPENAPQFKREAVLAYGGRVESCASNQRAREAGARRVQQQTGAVFVHPYNDYRVIAGQGTAALELLERYPQLRVLVVPVGGGGLISGCAIAAQGLEPSLRVIGAEPLGADDAQRSLLAGQIFPQESPQTVADGLRTSLGDLTFAIMQRRVEAIWTVDDREILAAMRLIWERMKLVVEPSAAVGLATAIKYRGDLADQDVGIILSGGNVDLDKVLWG